MDATQILDRYGEEVGRLILRLTAERDHALLLNEQASGKGNAVFWRHRYFKLFDQIGAIADVVGAPRASNYEEGHVLAAIEEALAKNKQGT